MLTKTNIRNANKFCCEDISKIENYDKALNDEKIYDCHHKLEIELNKSRDELKEIGLYFNRPASELIFLTHGEHSSLHKKIIKQETRDKISKNLKKYYESKENREKISYKIKKSWESQERHIKASLSLKGKKRTLKQRENISKAHLGKKQKKYIWLTPDYESVIMCEQAKQFHPDWIKIEEVK